jgi:peptidoglycan/LPS O-acetylase OafA/YrhL
MNEHEPASAARRYELDWLRVLSIFAVFVFHTLLFFATDDFYVKNASEYPLVDIVRDFFFAWGMPLVFVVSGASTFYALSRRSAGAFLRERAARLLVPLAAGLVSYLAWIIYLDRLGHGRFAGSFVEFIPAYFDGLDMFGGNFPWHGIHLWYLELLFVFSLLGLPLFLWLRQGSGRQALAWLGDRLAFPGGVYLLAVPLALLEAMPAPDTPLTARVYSGWSILSYLLIFALGFLLVSHERLYDGVRRLRWLSLAAAVLVTARLAAQLLALDYPDYGTGLYAEIYAERALVCWTWILAIAGFAAQRLRFATPALGYANEAVMPFYILHLPVLISVAYAVLPLPAPDLAKWLAILVLSFGLCAGLYEFVVRRINVLRVLFGMRPAPRAPQVATVPGA